MVPCETMSTAFAHKAIKYFCRRVAQLFEAVAPTPCASAVIKEVRGAVGWSPVTLWRRVDGKVDFAFEVVRGHGAFAPSSVYRVRVDATTGERVSAADPEDDGKLHGPTWRAIGHRV